MLLRVYINYREPILFSPGMHLVQRTHSYFSGYRSTTDNPSLLLWLNINYREPIHASPGIHQLQKRKPILSSSDMHQQQRTQPCYSGYTSIIQGTQTCFSEYTSTTENSTLLLWVYINYTGNPNLLLWVYIITHPCISRKSNLDSPGALNYWEERNLFSLGSFTIMIHAISYAEIILGKVPWDY